MKAIKEQVDWDWIKRMFAFEGEHPMQNIPSEPLTARFNAIRHNYKVYQMMVDQGLASWMDCNPYETGDWARIFTPIEMAAWHDIRVSKLALWPQLPVDRYFVDFGNPVVKVAIECDGAKFHDPAKDAIRDERLQDQGWEILRVPGWRCLKTLEDPDSDADYWERDQHRIDKLRFTMAGVIEEATILFEQRACLDMIGEGQ